MVPYFFVFFRIQLNFEGARHREEEERVSEDTTCCCDRILFRFPEKKNGWVNFSRSGVSKLRSVNEFTSKLPIKANSSNFHPRVTVVNISFSKFDKERSPQGVIGRGRDGFPENPHRFPVVLPNGRRWPVERILWKFITIFQIMNSFSLNNHSPMIFRDNLEGESRKRTMDSVGREDPEKGRSELWAEGETPQYKR